MVIFFKERIILNKRDREFKNEAVLNPEANKEGDNFHFNYDVLRKEIHYTIGYCRFEGHKKATVFWNWTLMAVKRKFEIKKYEYSEIVKVDDLYYLLYKGYDVSNAHSTNLAYTFFKPEYIWKKRGEVTNEVLGARTEMISDKLYNYYGATYKAKNVAGFNRSALVEELISREYSNN